MPRADLVTFADHDRRRTVALGYPCARATDAIDPKFRAVKQLEGFIVSSILSVNK